ncbi:hypothetical protein, partial [Raoultella planticola]|uniref:hypothetical protein n=1 Tax=Raoultella planticola TaxID=575 RepID=UPI001F0F99A5
GKNSLNRLIRCVCGKKIGPDPRNFNQRVSLGRNDLLIRTFLSAYGVTGVFVLLGAVSIIVAIAIATIGIETKGVSVESLGIDVVTSK